MHRGPLPEDAGKPAQHPVRPAEDFRAHCRVSLIEPSREADAPGYGIEFGYAEAMFRNQEIRSDDAWHVVLEGLRTLEFDEVGRLALVQPAGDPFRLLAFRALPVKQIDRSIELKQDASERFDLLCQGGPKRIGDRRGPPIVLCEQALGRQALPNEARTLGGIERCRGCGFWGHAGLCPRSDE